MSRKLIGLTTTAAFFLAVLLIITALMGTYQQVYYAEQTSKAYIRQISVMDDQALQKQRNLARWYNYCLSAKMSQPGFQEAYEEILNIYGGIMGCLEIPGMGLRLPIYHGAVLPSGSFGAGHVPGSALPVGGRGNHTVLTVPEEIAEVAEGESFCIHILGETLYFTVREVAVVSAGQTDGILRVEGEDLCTLSASVRKGQQIMKIFVHGIRMDGETEPDASYVDRSLLCSVLWAVTATLLLPLVTGGIGAAIRWGIKIGSCRRLTKNAR